ncbi:MAG: hypothetical protein GYA55_03820 [SAR324 cluster bacterium]|uniref:Potassium channel domain-containing protein n=1 Tax=SAR324 cluster bacterium TaxID=2024889 RepID=A0A7X9IJ53_9DELT|nr:hypothetical protein [SAR324 cluster bacterium]
MNINRLALGFVIFRYRKIKPRLIFHFPQDAQLLDSGVKDFLYFSIATSTTTGFGDITPVVSLARSLVITKTLIDQLFPAIIIARLMTLKLEDKKRNNR